MRSMLDVGEIALGRFLVERNVAAGGMGVIYRARDLETGGLVALKGVRMGTEDAARFEREAQALAMLEHPAIVRYVAHGVAERAPGDAIAFLAMQWLDGHDLAARLEQGPLGIADALVLGLRVSDALAVVHAAGLVHRDVKPGNIFLVGRVVDGATLVDFGLARGPRSKAVTADGTVIGTPAYMAPEQLRGGAPEPAIDVFGLGCVIYEALTGAPPHGTGASIAVLTRILVEEPRPLSSARSDVPPLLEALVASMLAKDPALRPRDGAAVARALRAATAGVARPSVIPPLREADRALGVLLLARWGDTSGAAEASVRAVAAQFGAEVAGLIGAGAALRFPVSDTPEEQAVLGARAALAMRQIPGLRAVSLGMRHPDEQSAASAIERTAPPVEAPAVGVVVDPVVAALLPSRFVLERRDRTVSLIAEVDALDLPREVLGRPTPFVARERERDLLVEQTLEAFAARRPAAFLVVGEAGSGKSRLRYEALRALGGRLEQVTVFSARGDVGRRGAPLSMISRSVARAAALSGDSHDLERLAARVARHVPPPEQAETTAALARMLGLSGEVGDDEGAGLDKALLGARIRDAFRRFLRHEAEAGPLLFIVEDLHEGDAASLWLLADAASTLLGLPVVVWAIARPDAEHRYGHRFASLAPTRVAVPPLGAREAELFARACLVDPTPVDVATLCARAPGNPLVLEELARAARGHPETELGSAAETTAALLVEARLDELEPVHRRMLRAGAVFGSVFWGSAVGALVGPEHEGEVASALFELEARGWVVTSSSSRFVGERELAFSCETYRAAAAGLLPADQRAPAHAAALHWLEIHGEIDAGVLAFHAAAAGLDQRAGELFAEATERAIIAADVPTAEGFVKRGLELVSGGAVRGRLHALAAEIHRWRGDSEQAMIEARAALADLDGSQHWFEAAGELATAASRLRHLDVLVDVAASLERALCPDPAPAQVVATARVAMFLEHAGATVRAEPLYAWLESVAPRFARVPLVTARVAFARAWKAHAEGDWSSYRDRLADALDAFRRAGDAKAAVQMLANLGHAQLELGLAADAERLSREALLEATRLGAQATVALAQNNLGMAVGRLGKHDESVSFLKAAVRSYADMKDPRLEGATQIYLVDVLVSAGRLAEAEAEAKRAVELLDRIPILLSHALAEQSRTLRARGRVADALVTAERAAAVLERAGRSEGSPVPVRLAHAEALLAAGEMDAAREQARVARASFEETASRISDPAAREAYRLTVPEQARLEALEQRLAASG
ncbi:MAG: protein kinase [Myxococcales bacterium]|nr:protein kinase [Myxococcales bacterium]